MANTGADPAATLSSNPLRVAAAVIRRGDGAILISLRAAAADQGGLWEFPGGKLEVGERDIDGLARELLEELGIGITRAVPLINVLHRYPGKLVSLRVMEVMEWSGTPCGREGQPICWVRPEVLPTYRYPAANLPVTVAVNLPRLVFVTPATAIDDGVLLARLAQCLSAGIRLVRLQLLDADASRRRQLAQAAVEICRLHGAQLMLDGTLDEAIAAGTHGVHLNAERLRQLSSRRVPAHILLSASCGNEHELRQAEALGVDFVHFGPVRIVPARSSIESPEWQRVRALIEQSRLPVFAEGDLYPADARAALRAGCQGIALSQTLWDGASPAAAVAQVAEAVLAAAYTTR